MRTRYIGLLSAAGLSVGLCGCMSAPKGDSGSLTDRSVVAAGAAVDQTRNGVGDAASMPLRDLNMMHDEIPPVLVRAYARPYDPTGLDSCPAIGEQIHMLDLALGPDVDIPRAESAEKDMFAKGASFAADAALDAVRSATSGILPVRSWVRRFSGANRAEQQAKAVALSGSVRCGYLKALGQIRGCEWPAAPLKPGTVISHLPPEPAAPPAALEAASRAAAAAGKLDTPPTTPQR